MINEDAKEHIKISSKLFEQKATLDARNQEIAENFYVERADFTVTRDIGNVFADHLFTSYPLVASRDLSDQIGSMLRPKSVDWFSMALLDDASEDHAARQWMQHKAKLMRRAMYDPSSQFQRATKEADRDYVNFGDCALSVTLNKANNGLLFRNWHLRDIAWSENDEGVIDVKYCKRKYTIKTLKETFGDSVHESIKTCKDQLKEISCLHIVVPNSQYGIKTKLKNVSLFVDCDNEHIMEAKGLATNYYIIPRWATVSGSQYAYSPAMIAALPDARLFQDMTRILLEAGEKAVDPPLVATEEAIRSDISIISGGITYVDADYDERLGQVLRPLGIDRSGIPLGMEMADKTQQMIAKALYLDKFSLPVYNEMTAYEAGIRASEHIRTIMPIFEPIEEEYNAKLCQEIFDVMWRAGWMGSVYDIPESIQRSPDYQFKFISPLTQAEENKKTNQFFSVQQVIQAAASINPGFVHNVDIDRAGREAIQGVGANETWLRDEEDVAQAQEADQQMQMAGQAAQAVNVGAEALSSARQAVNG